MSNDEPKPPKEPPPVQPTDSAGNAFTGWVVVDFGTTASSLAVHSAAGGVVGFPLGIALGAFKFALPDAPGLAGPIICGGGRGETPKAAATLIALAAQEAIPVAPRTYEDLASELVELEKQFPLPEKGEAVADSKWFDAHRGKPELTQYRGSFVAVLNGAVVGHGINSLQLQIDVVRKFNTHPQRFIIEYVPRPAF